MDVNNKKQSNIERNHRLAAALMAQRGDTTISTEAVRDIAHTLEISEKTARRIMHRVLSGEKPQKRGRKTMTFTTGVKIMKKA